MVSGACHASARGERTTQQVILQQLPSRRGTTTLIPERSSLRLSEKGFVVIEARQLRKPSTPQHSCYSHCVVVVSLFLYTGDHDSSAPISKQAPYVLATLGLARQSFNLLCLLRRNHESLLRPFGRRGVSVAVFPGFGFRVWEKRRVFGAGQCLVGIAFFKTTGPEAGTCNRQNAKTPRHGFGWKLILP